MFKIALSTVTALVVITNGLSAENLLSGNRKDMRPVPIETKTSYSDDIGSYYYEEDYDRYNKYSGDTIVSEPVDMKSKSLNAIAFVRPAKSHYRVGEPIRVQLKLKKSAYIYFWTVSRDGRGYLVLPNRYEKYNKYKPNLFYVVPSNSSKFNIISDRPGVEHLYVLATNKPISQQKIDSIFNQNSKFRFKDLVVTPKSDNLKYDIWEKEIPIYNR